MVSTPPAPSSRCSTERGYEATRYETILDKLKGKTAEEMADVVMGAYAGKLPISTLTDN